MAIMSFPDLKKTSLLKIARFLFGQKLAEVGQIYLEYRERKQLTMAKTSKVSFSFWSA
jgi:hypothetical protein